MPDKPAIYILHGDDEFGMAEFLGTIEKRMGDPATAEMNITRFDGRSTQMNVLVAATHALPFLSDRRLVVLEDPLGALKNASDRDRFKAVLEKTPDSTALVVTFSRPLVDGRDRDNRKKHWLLKWADAQGARVFLREFNLPHGPQMARWIQTKAVELGGEFSYQAASLLGNYVQDDPRLAAQEIAKLLAYVNYRRSVDPDDVVRLTPDEADGDVFKMVDALGNRNGQMALRILHRLLEYDEPLRLYGMVVRQFRLLIQVREMLDAGYREGDIAKPTKIHPWVVGKLVPQARNFSLVALEEIYHKLLEIDEAIKTGQTNAEVAMDTFIVALTT